MIPVFDIMCVSQTAYGYGKRSSTYRLPALKGRPRYRLRDTWAAYVVNIQWEFTPDQYAEFQDFWYNQINAGNDYFEMRLMLDDPEFYNTGNEVYKVHAVEGFQSTFAAPGYWTVRLDVEVPAGYRNNLAQCLEIYGGPVDNLAGDDYYGGPVDNLADDIIAPCDDVLGGFSA